MWYSRQAFGSRLYGYTFPDQFLTQIQIPASTPQAVHTERTLSTRNIGSSNGLADAMTTLQHLAGMPGLSPLSPFRGCIDLMLTITESIQVRPSPSI